MNSPARKWVNAIPEASSLRSISPCMRAKRKGESSSAMIPESLTTCLTPAFLAASMKFDCTSSIAGSEDEMSMARSTPRSAPVSVSGRAMSPSTISTFGSDEFHVELLVWEGSSKHAEEELEALPIACHLGGQTRIVVGTIRRDIQVSTLEITRIDHFIVEALELILISFLSIHDCPFLV